MKFTNFCKRVFKTSEYSTNVFPSNSGGHEDSGQSSPRSTGLNLIDDMYRRESILLYQTKPSNIFRSESSFEQVVATNLPESPTALAVSVFLNDNSSISSSFRSMVVTCSKIGSDISEG